MGVIPPHLPSDRVRLFMAPLGKSRIFGVARLSFYALIIRKILTRKYAAIIAYDAPSVVAAWLATRVIRIPFVYHSLELYLSNIPAFANRKARFWKRLERAAHAKASFTIVQDEGRARLLLDENRVRKAHVFYVPNSFGGLSRHQHGNSDYLRRKYGIPEKNRIMLAVGGIASFTRTIETIEAFLRCPPNWTLVIHGKKESDYFDRVQRMADGRRLILSTDFLLDREFDAMVASADVGFAIYDRGAGKNIEAMGLSSGRIAAYLRCGVPVVASGFPSLRQIIDSTSCGECVDSEDEIQQAVDRILHDYARYSSSALECYCHLFDFDTAYRAVVNELRLRQHS